MKTPMKFSLFLWIFLIALSDNVSGQTDLHSLQRFKFFLGGGLMVPQKLNGRMGIGFELYLEPHYYVTERVGVGLQIGAGSYSREIKEQGEGLSGRPFDLQLLAAVADYYFIQPRRRFFVGAGLGNYTLDEQVDHTQGQLTILRDELFGAQLRAGLEEKHIRFMLEYHIIHDAYFVSRNNYLGLQIAYFWGGARKRPHQ